jgi:very-short-patch-repair endonuclease
MKNNPLKISGMHDGATPRVFKNAAKLRSNMTEPEIKLWEYLKTKPLGYKFRRQHPISGYVLDFYCHKLKLSIEIDGGYHQNKEQKEKDAERTEYLNSVGITEYRFTNKDILNRFAESLEFIISKLRADTPSGVGGEHRHENENND